MNRLECGLFQITQDSCRCNIDGFQLIVGLYNSGKWEQNHTSFVYSFTLCICIFVGESCSTCVKVQADLFSMLQLNTWPVISFV